MTKENEREYDMPSVEPGLEEMPAELDIEKDKKSPIPPEKIQEIINMIDEKEKEDREHEEAVNDVIKKNHQ